jgi:hypothetical protein
MLVHNYDYYYSTQVDTADVESTPTLSISNEVTSSKGISVVSSGLIRLSVRVQCKQTFQMITSKAHRENGVGPERERDREEEGERERERDGSSAGSV